MKKLLLLVGAFVLIVFFCLVWFINSLSAVGGESKLKRFVVAEGQTAKQIGQNLEKEKIVKSAIAFRIYSQVTQSATNIKPGSYELPSNLWIPQIVGKFLEGPAEVWVTIPEGYRREEIAEKFSSSLGLSSEVASSFYAEFLVLTEDQEGYLFPDTYLVAKDATVTQIVKLLQENFENKVNFEVSRDNIILASIIERETLTNDERPVVAGILLKRISAGWPIQADATIQYALGSWEAIGGSDLELDSAYNTYINIGLPPTPISNPGISSIQAALNPVESPYWYYIHDTNGNIYYAESIEEHNANIEKYL